MNRPQSAQEVGRGEGRVGAAQGGAESEVRACCCF